MKTIKYIVWSIVMLSLFLSGITNLSGQKGSIEFLVTYTCHEITSNLELEDRFFQLLNTAPVVMERIEQGKCLISGDFSKNEASRLKKKIEKSPY